MIWWVEQNARIAKVGKKKGMQACGGHVCVGVVTCVYFIITCLCCCNHVVLVLITCISTKSFSPEECIFCLNCSMEFTRPYIQIHRYLRTLHSNNKNMIFWVQTIKNITFSVSFSLLLSASISISSYISYVAIGRKQKKGGKKDSCFL